MARLTEIRHQQWPMNSSLITFRAMNSSLITFSLQVGAQILILYLFAWWKQGKASMNRYSEHMFWFLYELILSNPCDQITLFASRTERGISSPKRHDVYQGTQELMVQFRQTLTIIYKFEKLSLLQIHNIFIPALNNWFQFGWTVLDDTRKFSVNYFVLTYYIDLIFQNPVRVTNSELKPYPSNGLVNSGIAIFLYNITETIQENTTPNELTSIRLRRAWNRRWFAQDEEMQDVDPSLFGLGLESRPYLLGSHRWSVRRPLSHRAGEPS
jgi:hypothetical protein